MLIHKPDSASKRVELTAKLTEDLNKDFYHALLVIVDDKKDECNVACYWEGFERVRPEDRAAMVIEAARDAFKINVTGVICAKTFNGAVGTKELPYGIIRTTYELPPGVEEDVMACAKKMGAFLNKRTNKYEFAFPDLSSVSKFIKRLNDPLCYKPHWIVAEYIKER